MSIVRNGTRIIFFAVLACSLGAGIAWGHSGLKRSEPPVESRLKRAPSEVKLYFTERLEAAYSNLRVEGNGGVRVDRQDSHVDRANPLLLRATLQPLTSGTYTVIWRVLSVDSHVTEGRFTFRIE